VSSTPNDPTTGDYPDSDLGDVEAGEGTYTDQETPEEKRGEEPDLRGPEDRGEYTDSDVVPQHRPTPPRGGYTSTDTGTHTSTSNDEVEEHPHG
jgi:hypothetical protein